MKTRLLSAALLLASGGAMANSNDHVHIGCDISSDYSVDTYRRAFVFVRDGHKDVELGIGGGRLFINGKEQKLSEADHLRLRHLEDEMRALVPEIEHVTVEAVDIAFTALTEVARGLSSDPQDTVATLEATQRRVRSEMATKPLAIFNEEAMGDLVKPIVTKYLPDLIGGAVKNALKAAFGGEKASAEFQARIDHMQHDLDTKVDARAKKLEPLAAAMCQRLRRMDGIDDSLEFRTPDGEPLQLLSVKPNHED